MVYTPIRIHPRELNAQNKWMQQTSRKWDKARLGGKGAIVQVIVSWQYYQMVHPWKWDAQNSVGF